MKKYRLIKNSLLFCSCFLILLSCTKGETYKQNFEKNIDKYVEACIPAFIAKGVDTITAKQVCRCIMETSFEIDSTIFSKRFSENKLNIDSLINLHMSDYDNKCGILKLKQLSEEVQNQ